LNYVRDINSRLSSERSGLNNLAQSLIEEQSVITDLIKYSSLENLDPGTHEIVVQVDTVSPEISELTGRIVILTNSEPEMDRADMTIDSVISSVARSSTLAAAAASTSASASASASASSARAASLLGQNLTRPKAHSCSGKTTKITTNFVGQILDNSRNYLFETRQWNSFIQADKYYWSKFDQFKNSWSEQIKKPGFKPNFNDQDHIFMRWKEIFHEAEEVGLGADLGSVETTASASRSRRTERLEQLRQSQRRTANINAEKIYSGYYYICFSKKTGAIKGFYCQHDSVQKKSQENELNLEYISNHSDVLAAEPTFCFMG